MCFTYFGQKEALLPLYSPPAYDLIIEPFAGSARYACRYGLERDVWLNDLYPVIYEVWKWIINATLSDVKALPSMTKTGDSLDNYKQLSEAERNLLGFVLGVSIAKPQKIMTKFSARNRAVLRLKRNLKKIVGKISHWKITNDEYYKIPNMRCTWFVDPPYQFYGEHYAENAIDYDHLGRWCRERKGQVTVCEAAPANWLPFKELKSPLEGNISRVRRKDKYREVKYYRSDRKVGLLY